MRKVQPKPFCLNAAGNSSVFLTWRVEIKRAAGLACICAFENGAWSPAKFASFTSWTHRNDVIRLPLMERQISISPAQAICILRR